MSIVVLSS